MWPLTVYEIPMIVIEGMERKVPQTTAWQLTKFHVNRSLHLVQLQKPISSVEEEYKVEKCRAVLRPITFRESEDDRVRGDETRQKVGSQQICG